MNSTQEWLCRILEETTDRQDDIRWFDRNWDYKDWRAWIACCFALPFYIKGERDVLARVLRCFCDAESGGSQHSLIEACEAFCERPYGDEVFIHEVVKAAPVMLKVSPIFFGEFFCPLIMHNNNFDIAEQYFLNALENLPTKEEQQTIIVLLCHLNITICDLVSYGFINQCR